MVLPTGFKGFPQRKLGAKPITCWHYARQVALRLKHNGVADRFQGLSPAKAGGEARNLLALRPSGYASLET